MAGGIDLQALYRGHFKKEETANTTGREGAVLMPGDSRDSGCALWVGLQDSSEPGRKSQRSSPELGFLRARSSRARASRAHQARSRTPGEATGAARTTGLGQNEVTLSPTPCSARLRLMALGAAATTALTGAPKSPPSLICASWLPRADSRLRGGPAFMCQTRVS